MSANKVDHDGDGPIMTRAQNDAYRAGWDRIFGAKASALKDYWNAKTPDAERAAYDRMMALGLPDAYKADSGLMSREKLKEAGQRIGMECLERAYAKVGK